MNYLKLINRIDELKGVYMKNEELLTKERHEQGLYSIKELCVMFHCGRSKIDFAVNTGQLNYLSPNGRDRFIYFNDFLEYSIKKDNTTKIETEAVLSNKMPSKKHLN